MSSVPVHHLVIGCADDSVRVPPNSLGSPRAGYGQAMAAANQNGQLLIVPVAAHLRNVKDHGVVATAAIDHREQGAR